MGSPYIGLDVDDVLLDYFEGFLPYMASRGHRVERPDQVFDPKLSDALPDLSRDECVAGIKEFAKSPEFAHVPPAEGACEVLKWLRETYPGIKIIAITACGIEPETRRMRTENVERYFEIDDLISLPLGASKLNELRKLPNGSVFVDDMYHHVKSAEESGLCPILFRRGHNLKFDYVRVANDWWHCRDFIVEILDEAKRKDAVCGFLSARD